MVTARAAGEREDAADTYDSHDTFDAIVVGARVAGSATAHMLAGMGWRVALVERKRRPLGPTLSLPITQPRGLARFRDLGLFPAIERIMPQLQRVRSLRLEMSGGVVIAGAVPAFDGYDYAVILRREALDDALLDYVLAAHPDAITLYDGANVDDLIWEQGCVCGVRIHSLTHDAEANNPDDHDDHPDHDDHAESSAPNAPNVGNAAESTSVDPLDSSPRFGAGDSASGSDGSDGSEELLSSSVAHGTSTATAAIAARPSPDAMHLAGLRELRAPLVIGADGRFSRIARLVEAREYRRRQSYTTLYYSYARNIDLRGLGDVTFMAAANKRMVVFANVGSDSDSDSDSDGGEGLQVMSAWFPVAQYAAFRRDPAGEMRATWESVPALRERTANIALQGKIMGLAPQDGYFRPTGGPGWALVGDARHFKDPASGQGLHDALYSVERLGEAIQVATGGAPITTHAAAQRFQAAIARAQRVSDRELRPMYDFTYTFAEGLVRPPTLPERLLLRAVAGDPTITRQFLGINSGATDVRAFNRAAPFYLLRGAQLSFTSRRK